MDFQLFLSYFVWDIDPVFFKFGFLELRYYSVLFATALFLAHRIASKYLRKYGWSEKELDALFIYCIIPLIVFSHLFHLLFYEISSFTQNPIRILEIGKGLSSHGAVFGVICGFFLFCYQYRKNLLILFDAAGFGSMITSALIRLGNFFNSEIIGEPTNIPWAVIFLRRGVEPRHPAQLYEAIMSLFIFFCLVVVHKRFKKHIPPGVLGFSTILAYFLYRFFIEFFKTRQAEVGMNIFLKMGQTLSIPFILASLGTIIYLFYKERTKNKYVK